jgi:hypothetical protein
MGLGPLGRVQAHCEEFVSTEKSSGPLRKCQFPPGRIQAHRPRFNCTVKYSFPLGRFRSAGKCSGPLRKVWSIEKWLALKPRSRCWLLSPSRMQAEQWEGAGPGAGQNRLGSKIKCSSLFLLLLLYLQTPTAAPPTANCREKKRKK